MKILAASLGSFLLLAALSARAQSPDAASKPAEAPAKAPARATPEQKPKKVWTNDEIGSVKGTVSVVGDDKSSSRSSSSADSHLVSTTTEGSADARQKQIADYRNRINDYQNQIDAIDKRIAQLKDFKAENSAPTGGINPAQGYNMIPVEDQVKQLDDQKKKLQAKLDDTESEARKNGIEPGDLR
jgi:chromosome segregation ATPase